MRRFFLAASYALCISAASAQTPTFEIKPLAPPESNRIAQEEAVVMPEPQVMPEEEMISPEPTPIEEKAPSSNGIALRGLNKVTARVSTLEAPLGTVIRFGNLEIIAHRCWEPAPGERPESAGLLEIWERKTGEAPEKLFSGWMFASSPALSALSHPVYDVMVLSCKHLELEEELEETNN